jgi:N-dimethylarginine dimethylaminohydrolase
VIITDKRFIRLNNWLIKNGFSVEAIDYDQISKMGGLFRCSTMPLERI